MPCMAVSTIAPAARALGARAGPFAAIDMIPYALPPYSPARSGIEPIRQDVKYHGMGWRSYTGVEELRMGLDAALTRKAATFVKLRLHSSLLLSSNSARTFAQVGHSGYVSILKGPPPLGPPERSPISASNPVSK